MKGTFKPGDKLFVEKLPLSQIKRGDAIIFSNKNKSKDEFVVHRVVNKGPGGLVTRGDNNPYQDKELVTEENVIGKVARRERNGKIYKVWGGGLGILKAKALHGRIQAIRVLKNFLGKPYRILKKSGIIPRIWRPEIETIHFETRDGPLIKYVHKGKTVAMHWTDKNGWWYRQPYDFIIGPKIKINN